MTHPLAETVARQPLTPEQFRDEMKRIADAYGPDDEAAHIKMDKLLAETLSDLGYHEGVAIFNEQTKWYA